MLRPTYCVINGVIKDIKFTSNLYVQLDRRKVELLFLKDVYSFMPPIFISHITDTNSEPQGTPSNTHKHIHYVKYNHNWLLVDFDLLSINVYYNFAQQSALKYNCIKWDGLQKTATNGSIFWF